MRVSGALRCVRDASLFWLTLDGLYWLARSSGLRRASESLSSAHEGSSDRDRIRHSGGIPRAGGAQRDEARMRAAAPRDLSGYDARVSAALSQAEVDLRRRRGNSSPKQ